MKNYKDITKKMLNDSIPNSHQIKELHFWIINNKIFKVDGKNVILDYSQKELNIAFWIKRTFGGEIYLCPRVNFPEGIQTPDYIWNNERWDLKVITGSSNQVIYHSIYKKNKQSKNYIFDITKSHLNIYDVKTQLKSLLNRKDTIFLQKSIIKKGSDFVVLKRM